MEKTAKELRKEKTDAAKARKLQACREFMVDKIAAIKQNHLFKLSQESEEVLYTLYDKYTEQQNNVRNNYEFDSLEVEKEAIVFILSKQYVL